MGNFLSNFLPNFITKLFAGTPDCKIVMLGLDAAGKTSILYHIKDNAPLVTVIPTIGFNIETVSHSGVKFTAWDVGGRDGTRSLMRHYFGNCDVLIFVVDSNDKERMSECETMLHKALEDERLQDAIVLVFANKQDLPSAMSVQEVAKALNLNGIRQTNWFIQACTAKQGGEGLFDGLHWIAETWKNKHK